MTLPVIAIVGRPNVGKSTLFNRLAGRRVAVVSDTPGTTRDRVSTDTSWRDYRFLLVDTGGFELAPEQRLTADVRSQMERALDDAAGLILDVDIKDGVNPTDLDVADLIRRYAKPTIVAANKADNIRLELLSTEFHSLGLGDPIPISAYHDTGTGDLLDALFNKLDMAKNAEQDNDEIRIAIVGRPNVGKSALFNVIVGDERAIVSPVPGTTRDAIDTRVDWDNHHLLFIDTAGLRRRGKLEMGIEKYSVIRTLQAIERSHVVFLVLDTSELVTQQDTHIAGFIDHARRASVIVINKWDLASFVDLTAESAQQQIVQRFKFLPGTPVQLTSALNATGIGGLLKAAISAFDEFDRSIPDDELNRVVVDAFAEHQPPSKGRLTPVFKGVRQVRTRPPTIRVQVANPELIHFSYRRYLENCLREHLGFDGSPLRLEFTAGK